MPDFAVKTTFSAIDRVTTPLKKMEGAVTSFGHHADHILKHVGEGLMGPLSGMLPALTGAGLVEFGEKCIEKFDAAEAAIANVNAGLASTHNAIGLNTAQFEKMAGSLSGNGIIGKSDILENATAQLLTFGGITKENFGRIQTAAVDVATKLHGIATTGEDVRAVSIMMGKAMDNPIKGMTAMRRIGITFNKDTEQLVKNLMAQNKTLDAQNLILQDVEQYYGGTNAALAKTSEGMEILMQHKMAANMAAIGKELAPLKEAFLEFALEALPLVTKAIPYLGTAFKILLPILGLVALAWAYYKVQVGYALIKTMALGIAEKGLAVATVGLQAAQWLLNAAMTANPIGLVIVAIAALIGFVVLAISHWNSFGAAMTLILGPIGAIISVFKTVYDRWDQIKKAFQTEGIMGGILMIGKAILDGLLYPIQQVLELLSHLPVVGKYAAQAASGIQGFREGTLQAPKAPNQTEAEGKHSGNNTTVNIHSNGTKARADVAPRNSAQIRGNIGENEFDEED